MFMQPSVTFQSPELAGMHQGVVFMAAPVYGGNIQIDQRVADGHALLRIIKDEVSVRVDRLDERPVQVEINRMEEPHENEYGTSRLVRHKVFHEPARSVAFVEKQGAENYYIYENPSGVHAEYLRKFAEVLGSTALMKQRKLSDVESHPKVFIVQPSGGGSYLHSPARAK